MECFTVIRYWVESYRTDQGDKRFTVVEDGIAIYDTGDEQDARGYERSLNATVARLQG
jgi:hypothetical protein